MSWVTSLLAYKDPSPTQIFFVSDTEIQNISFTHFSKEVENTPQGNSSA